MEQTVKRPAPATPDTSPEAGLPRQGWIDVFSWGVIVLMAAAAGFAWVWAPEALPVHWDAAGNVDRYGARWEALLLQPGLAALVVLALRYLPELDPLRGRYREFAGAYAAVRLVVVLGLAVLYGVTLLAALGWGTNVAVAIPGLAAVLLAVIGLTLDRLRPNWFIGIRTPWTLTSEHSWVATHRAGKWVFLMMAVGLAIAGILRTQWAATAAAALCLFGALGLFVYSYAAWRSDPARR